MNLFGKKSKKKATRIFFATDIHGSEVSFRKFVNAGKFYEADVLILGGDVAGKLLIPIVKDGHTCRASLHGQSHTLETETELAEFKRKLGILGFYSVMLSPDEYTAMKDDTAAQDKAFMGAARQRLADWINLAEERLKDSALQCYITGGNDDPWEVLAALEENAQEHVVPCEGHTVQIDEDHAMVSLGYSNETPWKTPREISEDELAQKIVEAIHGVGDFGRCIFNFHCPPKDSTLDTCPMLDTSTDPPTVIMEAGNPVLFGAGSTSVRAAINKYQPMLALHGHIHESRGIARLGKTVCINPGSEYGEGILHGVIVNILDGKIEGYQLTSG
ncbi:MAG: metallophosphoesterase [Chloroflexi bacterium]|nr:metallophosphoesterase [Chloroflexota bacterium]